MIYGKIGFTMDNTNHSIGTVAQCFFNASEIFFFVLSFNLRPLPCPLCAALIFCRV